MCEFMAVDFQKSKIFFKIGGKEVIAHYILDVDQDEFMPCPFCKEGGTYGAKITIEGTTPHNLKLSQYEKEYIMEVANDVILAEYNPVCFCQEG